MLVRKNTKAFKTIQELLTICQTRGDRETLIRLYVTKAGDSIKDRISIEGIQGDAALFYEMTYQTILNNLKSSNHQLQMSDEHPGIYYFHSTSNKVWDETPFEFDEAIKDEFGSLPELPLVRKKEAVKKFVLPSAESSQTAPEKKDKATRKEKRVVDKSGRHDLPKGPDFKLRHPVEFSNLDRLVYRQAKVTKREVLEYYDRIAEYLLPWLKDRALSTRLQADGGGKYTVMTPETLFNDHDEMPEWVKTAQGPGKNAGGRLLLCNDKEHLLLYVERGCLEFNPSHARTKEPASPDYIVIAIDSPDSGLEKAIAVALTAREILTGLKLKSFVKTDGVSGLHIYLPLDAKSDHETSLQTAGFICKLIRLKIPDIITLKGSGGYVSGKVSLDYSVNKEGSGIIAPYSLVASQSPTVAAPLLLDELGERLDAQAFNHKSIFERIRDIGDPFDGFFKRKVNAEELFTRLEENYGFLL